MVSPIFLPTVPDRNPRTECGCHPVAFINSLVVTPPGRFSSSSILSVLLPSRTGLAALAFFAPLGAFLAGVAFFPGLAFAGATGARRGARAAFLLALGCSSAAGVGAAAVSSVIFILVSPVAVITAVTTWIALASP